MDMRTGSTDRQRNIHAQPSNRLILCFDGTGNMFQGHPGDTNIVKLYNMFDRSNTSQMHYYQPGIGTYPAEGPVNVSWFRTLMRKFEAVWDSALATSFDSHVIAGYKFIMRYYKPGDRIYVFGFSRGAFTARFLSRMISHVGLLSMGNEEMVPFAYRVYEEYEKSRDVEDPKHKEHANRMNSFKKHFCRTELKATRETDVGVSRNESGIKVHFLGLFDCVSSVGNLDVPFSKKTPPLPAVHGTATHVRHAVAIDERRVKFKAALFSQEQTDVPKGIKEVWFPGNHGDIGGGWHVGEEGIPRDSTEKDKDYFQLSDIALKWMVDEIDNVETSHEDPLDRFAWDLEEKASFLERFQKRKIEMISARMHDTMTWNGGSSIFKVILWNLMEFLPWVIKRWEHVENPRDSGSYIWSYIGWPPNRGERRDIPSNALFHRSVIDRMALQPDPDPEKYRTKCYVPTNFLWVQDSSVQLKNGASKATTAPHAADTPHVVKRNLSELANRSSPKDCDCENETQPLVKSDIRFVLDNDLTKGSVAVEGESVVVGAKKSDGIYRVVLDSH